MEQMHVMAGRVNNLLDTVEEPIKSLVPQITRTIKAADAMVEQLSAPIDRVVPGLSTLADVLASPTLDGNAQGARRLHGCPVGSGAPAAAAGCHGRIGGQHVRPSTVRSDARLVVAAVKVLTAATEARCGHRTRSDHAAEECGR